MKSIAFPLLVFLLSSLVPTARGAADDIYGPLDPKDLELEVEQPQESICPYQAIRLRCTLRNISKSTLKHAVLLDDGVAFWIRGHSEKTFSRPPHCILLYPEGRSTIPSASSGFSTKVPLFLGPGEKTSVSFAFAAAWRDNRGERLPIDRGNPIFAEPGIYVIKCGYCVDNKENKFIEQTLKIHVRIPEGQDKDVYELLKNDQQLASALMRPVDVPAKEAVPKLKDIVDKFPKSSYVPYARFALARAYLHGLGLDTTSSRVRRAHSGDELEAVIKQHYNEEIKKVVPNNFPYRPNALILLSKIDPNEKWSSRTCLHREYPDSMEWIEEFAPLLPSRDLHGRYEAEVLVGKFPSDDRILPVIGEESPITKFMYDKWRSFRKR